VSAGRAFAIAAPAGSQLPVTRQSGLVSRWTPARVGVIMLALLAALCLFAGNAAAQQFPKLTGRVVDEAHLLSPADVQDLTARLEALETKSSRQLVVATVPSLGGYEIEDYGYRLGRAWGIGQKEANNGAILLVAPNERKVRVEVGYGLEPILTDAFSNRVIDEIIVPQFKAGDMPGGIKAGTDALIAQLQAPPEVAERAAIEAAQKRAQQQQQQQTGRGGGVPGGLIFWGLIILFVLMSFGRRSGGRRYRGRSRGGINPWVVLWGLNELNRSSHRGGGWGGGGWGGGGGFGGGGGGGFGGFSGGGGSFGGGGASGSW